MTQYPLSSLDWRQFENLCAALLTAEGYTHIRAFARPGQPDRGIDWITTAPNGDLWVVQAKVLPRPMSRAEFQRVVNDLQNGLVLTGARQALFAISDSLPQRLLAEVRNYPDLHIWDGSTISELLDKHESVRSAAQALISSTEALSQLISRVAISSDETARGLTKTLRNIKPGREDWRAYENVCIDILNYAFVPPLRIPIIQSRSEDGLDRRDAIYPIGQGNSFWESLKYQYSTRMVVVEFKNYSDPIAQQQVESLQQYLLPKAKRSVGLICSRTAPSISALKARRRAWMVSENIILFLSDDELQKIIERRSASEDPSTVLDSLMDDFFVELAP